MAKKSKRQNQFLNNFKNNKAKFFVIIAAIMFFGGLLIYPTYAKKGGNGGGKGGGKNIIAPGIKLKASSTRVNQSGTFTVDVYSDSLTEPVNAVAVEIQYDASALELTKIDTMQSAFDIKAEEIAENGLIQIARGKLEPLSGEQFVATLSFTANASKGNAKIDSNSSRIISSSSNQNIAANNEGISIRLSR